MPSCEAAGLPRQIVERLAERREAPGDSASADAIVDGWRPGQRRGFAQAGNEDSRGGMSRDEVGAASI